jgi:LPXTG-site transpeptidase (sortase) family protein
MTSVLTRGSGAAHAAPEPRPSAPRPRRLSRFAKAAAAARQDATGRRTPATVTVMSGSVAILGLLLLTFVAELTFLGGLRHAHQQASGFNTLRSTLANATTPVGPRTGSGELVPTGTPVALLEIPAIRLKEVVLEGTSSEVLQSGAGHRRDTPLPGQPGVSLVYGRAAAYGGPFAALHQLTVGDPITVVTGQGRQVYQVTDLRRAGDPEPPALTGTQSRLSIETADGPSFAPRGVLRVDARLLTASQPRPAPAFLPGQVPADELAMSGETGALYPLVLWAQALLVASVALAWARIRWGGWQTWVVGLPIILLVTVQVSDRVSALLPNLL